MRKGILLKCASQNSDDLKIFKVQSNIFSLFNKLTIILCIILLLQKAYIDIYIIMMVISDLLISV